jgi:2-keto-4-pentenoate hydratase/2-oxohepta-3-ene-1,7-dioic acid hydratase in catechol pathway
MSYFAQRATRASCIIFPELPIFQVSAILAQLVEQLTRNEQVVGSSPMDGSKAPHYSGVFHFIQRRRQISFPFYITVAMFHHSNTSMPAVTLQSHPSPVQVNTIYCIGRNYIRHIQELENEAHSEPVLFLKPAASLIVQGRDIELPAFSHDIHHEAEVVLLAGKEGRNIQEPDALGYIAGVGLGLDLTARDTQQSLKQKGLPWTISKGFETAACVSDFLPLHSVPPLDALRFTLHVNGELRQEGDSSLMIFSSPTIISFISSIVTLLPGDLIFTGTPHGVAAIQEGDVLELRLAGLLHAGFTVGSGQ